MSNFPKEWNKIPFKAIKDPDDRYGFTGGPFGSDLMNKDYIDVGVRVVQLQNIGEGKFNTKSKIYTSVEKADSLSTCNIYPGDIVLSKMAEPIARACIVPAISKRYLMCSDGIRVSVDKNKYNTAYSCYFINSNYFRNEAETASTGTTRKRIGLTELAVIPFYAPSLNEQKKIAEILASIDKVIELTEIEIEKLKNLKKGMMQDLLTKGIGHTKFKDSPLGEIPENWEVKKFTEVTKEIFLGLTTKVDYVETGGYPLVRAKDVNTGKLKFDVIKYISEKQHKELTKYRKAQRNDILVTKSGTLGICAKVNTDREFSIYESIIVIRGKDSLDSDYLLWLLRDERSQQRMVGGKVGSTIGHLNLQMFRKLKIQIPPITEQKRIAIALNSVLERHDSLMNKHIALKNIKKGLMQDLLIGKVRVKV